MKQSKETLRADAEADPKLSDGVFNREKNQTMGKYIKRSPQKARRFTAAYLKVLDRDFVNWLESGLPLGKWEKLRRTAEETKEKK